AGRVGRLGGGRRRRRYGGSGRSEREHSHERHGEAGEIIRRLTDFRPALHGDLVIELQVFGRNAGGEILERRPVGIVFIEGRGNRLDERDAVQQRGEGLEGAL